MLYIHSTTLPLAIAISIYTHLFCAIHICMNKRIMKRRESFQLKNIVLFI